jgi:hypothetical protein
MVDVRAQDCGAGSVLYVETKVSFCSNFFSLLLQCLTTALVMSRFLSLIDCLPYAYSFV